MQEKLVIVPRKLSSSGKLRNMIILLAACVCLLLAFFVRPFVFFIPGLILAGVWIWLAYFSDVEYEYTYYDGELRFAKIINKARRKNLANVNMEDVLILAPKGDRSVYKYETDQNIKCKNLTSGIVDAKIYEVIYKSENGTIRYEFEPDEEMLDAMLIKYSRIVIK